MSRQFGTKIPFGQNKHDKNIIAAIDAYWKEHASAPTYREIADACGGISTSQVVYVVPELVKLGYRVAMDGRSRSITPPWVYQAIERAANGNTNGRKDGGK